MNSKLLLLSLFFLVVGLRASAQFFINGSASSLSNNCYQLTDDALGNSGSIWEANKINLDSSFTLIMELFLGCKDMDGADGIVLGFQPVSTSVGTGGGGIGLRNYSLFGYRI